MDQLIISVHNFLAEVATSSWVDDRHLALAEGLKDEVVTLYSDWDAASGRVRVSLERTEESASKLAEIERELIQFRNSLKSKQLHLMSQPRNNKHFRRRWSSGRRLVVVAAAALTRQLPQL